MPPGPTVDAQTYAQIAEAIAVWTRLPRMHALDPTLEGDALLAAQLDRRPVCGPAQCAAVHLSSPASASTSLLQPTPRADGNGPAAPLRRAFRRTVGGERSCWWAGPRPRQPGASPPAAVAAFRTRNETVLLRGCWCGCGCGCNSCHCGYCWLLRLLLPQLPVRTPCAGGPGAPTPQMWWRASADREAAQSDMQ
jgi:hypothetical protein